MKQKPLVTDRVLFATNAMVIAGFINPLLKQFEMFTKNAYDRPKHKEMLTRFGPVSSCGQEIVELHPIKTKNIVQTDSTTDGRKIDTNVCQRTMLFCVLLALFGKNAN